jgi:acyl carrier protein
MEAAKKLAGFIEKQDNLYLPDIACTLQTGREAMENRLAVVVNTKEELVCALKEFVSNSKENSQVGASIPVYRRCGRGGLRIKGFISGKMEETIVQVLLEERNLEKLAFFWVKGGRISWELLNKGYKVRRITLPTYPFEKRYCWVEHRQKPGIKMKPDKTLYGFRGITEGGSSINDRIIDIVAGLLGMMPKEISLNKPLEQYGFDSILSMQLIKQLQNHIIPSANLTELGDCKTVQDMVDVLKAQGLTIPLPTESKPDSWPQFPELINLNGRFKGPPVFWFHGGLGGAEIYRDFAQRIERPFYGIQARGWMTERNPLYGLQAMAAYYVHIIQTVQPDGPYDFGGYSLGGVLAYEVTPKCRKWARQSILLSCWIRHI